MEDVEKDGRVGSEETWEVSDDGEESEVVSDDVSAVREFGCEENRGSLWENEDEEDEEIADCGCEESGGVIVENGDGKIL